MSFPDFILGVDPGLGGGFGLYCVGQPAASRVWGTPIFKGGVSAGVLHTQLVDMRSQLKGLNIHAAVENVHSRPRQAGAFNFGLSTGIIHGVLAANGIPMTLIAPSVWKVKMGLQRSPDEPQGATKDRARELAAKLFPNLADQFKRKKDDGRAEALLLAVYYHHTLTGGK